MDKDIRLDQLQNYIELFGQSMDDYLYVFDFVTGEFLVSPQAVERFNVPGVRFVSTPESMQQFICSEDIPTLVENLKEISDGKADGHDLEYRWIDREGKTVWINCKGTVLKTENTMILVGCLNEIGKKQKADNASGLLKTTSLQNEFENHAGQGKSGFFLRIGIDNFKEINENMGLDYGDMILHKTAECIQGAIVDQQKLYKLMADEFAVVDFSGRSEEEAIKLYRAIKHEVVKFIRQNHYEVFFTVSGGIVPIVENQKYKFDNIMRITEFSLNQAKRAGKNQYYVYDERDYDDFRHRRWLVQVMRKAINHNYNGFDVHFQPIVNVNTGYVYGAETLLRFKTGTTMVSPVEFIPLLEESSLIVPAGRWVISRALEACKKIREYISDFRISVNVSYVQILKSDVLKEILDALAQNHLPPDCLMVELTESGLLEENLRFRMFCDGMRENGILLALDDFGTGYSNFHYLYSLNPYTIKIDRSFTVKAITSENEYNLLRHMVEMTHGIDLKLCIEGIETKDELEKISHMNPDYIQGYFYGRPCPFDEFVDKHVKCKES